MLNLRLKEIVRLPTQDEERGWLKKFRLLKVIPGLAANQKNISSHHELAHLLNKTIEAEIIPKLFEKHHDLDLSAPKKRGLKPIPETDVQHFLEILKNSTADIAIGYTKSLMYEGYTVNDIYLHLLTPTARQMQCYWELDEYTFSDITIAVGKMQQVMHFLGSHFSSRQNTDAIKTGKAMLFAMPRSQHTIGVMMLNDFFIQAGWDVWASPLVTEEEILENCSQEHYDVIGISIAYEMQWNAMQNLISKIRVYSKNKGIKIMAGGSLFNEKPELIQSCLADLCTLTADEAVKAAADLLK